MKIQVLDGLPYVTAELSYRGQTLDFARVIIDTGSAGTILSADKAAAVGLLPEPHDAIRRIWGVGGAEFVFAKQVDGLAVGDLRVAEFEVEIGAMGYGFEIEGIVGMDFLMATGAVIDLARLEIGRASASGGTS